MKKRDVSHKTGKARARAQEDRPGLWALAAGNAAAGRAPEQKPAQKPGLIIGLSQGKLAGLTLLLFIAIMAVSSFTLKPQLENPEFVTLEGKLVKNAQLGVASGETYVYVYSVGNDSANLTYQVSDGYGCTLITLVEGHTSVCLDSAGNDAAGQNASYAVQGMLLTRPWMLAIGDGWSWNVSAYIVYQGLIKYVGETDYAEVRKEFYKGRESYVVRIDSSENTTAWDWVDSEKRILLREIGPGYETELVSGLPDWNSSSHD